jgi:hypothetical protein
MKHHSSLDFESDDRLTLHALNPSLRLGPRSVYTRFFLIFALTHLIGASFRLCMRQIYLFSPGREMSHAGIPSKFRCVWCRHVVRLCVSLMYLFIMGRETPCTFVILGPNASVKFT